MLPLISLKKIRTIAIYLPQFHPVPENDAWWGKGFTEWTNVAKAKPLFKGHNQPHLPADLGFYDLRLPAAREAQAQLAKEHGIYGFCYYHYWFNGRRILERPFQEVFDTGKPDFPFMLCWANENWSRNWDGGNRQMLIGQTYSPEDDRRHIQALIPYFRDKRYIRIDDKPVFAIYRSKHVPEMSATIQVWREEAAKHNMELYICRFESCLEGGETYMQAGFDAAIDFQPWGRHMFAYKQLLMLRQLATFRWRLHDLVFGKTVRVFSKQRYRKYRNSLQKRLLQQNIFSYKDYLDFVIQQQQPSYKVYPGITPMWDNTPRNTRNPGIALGACPDLYKEWLLQLVKSFNPYSADENLVFINAWNEWAEGCHLEPCSQWGRQYLEVTREVLQDYLAQN